MDARLETLREPLQLTRAFKLVPSGLDNRAVRRALRENLVSFPAQIPIFEKLCRPDLQRNVVLLYFVRGWNMEELASRYGVARQRMGQILTAWRSRAVKEGYIEAIDPEHAFFKTPATLKTPPREVALRSVRVDESRRDRAPEREAILDVLENQLRLCSKALNGNGDTEALFERARVLCARLEAEHTESSATRERRTTMVLSAAREMFSKFSRMALEYRSAG